MKKFNVIGKILIIGILLLMSAALWAAQYSITMTTKYGCSYSGDYSGQVTTTNTTFTIGPYANPFTVTIVPAKTTVTLASGQSGGWCWVTLDRYSGLTVNGVSQSAGTSITLTSTTPTASITEIWTQVNGDDFNCNAGRARIIPQQPSVAVGNTVDTTIDANVGMKYLAAFSFIIFYQAAYLIPDTSYGTNGVSIIPSDFTISVNIINPGMIQVAGFSTTGKSGSGMYISLLNIRWKALQAGTTAIQLDVSSLTDLSGAQVATTLSGMNTTITITGTSMLYGDVNGSGAVDIVDALMTAQYAVGFNPADFNTIAADVNNDKTVNIVDALIIAQYYVGLVSKLPLQ